ncbi:hypothetical protein K0M31_001468 [Melipona bicolor]|uniref:Uncharacterized protein n=1 Tax=Melipona bicolor TaxID=60889 RepID=A0AA40GFJ3_9HYME|nr:hypothetical protein K0M31_001468 [Melipona bicolor]
MDLSVKDSHLSDLSNAPHLKKKKEMYVQSFIRPNARQTGQFRKKLSINAAKRYESKLQKFVETGRRTRSIEHLDKSRFPLGNLSSGLYRFPAISVVRRSTSQATRPLERATDPSIPSCRKGNFPFRFLPQPEDRGVLSNFLCRTTNTVEAPLRFTFVHSTYSTCTCIFKTAWSRFARRSDCRFQTTVPRRDDLFAKSAKRSSQHRERSFRGFCAKCFGCESTT